MMNTEKGFESSGQGNTSLGQGENVWEDTLKNVTFAGMEQDVNGAETNREDELRKNILKVVHDKYRAIGEYFPTMSKEAVQSGLVYGEDIASDLHNLWTTGEQNDEKVMQALIDYIDQRFGGDTDSGASEQDIQDKKSAYLEQVKTTAMKSSDIFDEIGTSIRQGKSDDEWILSNMVHRYGKLQGEVGIDMAEKYAAYIENPTKKGREQLSRDGARGSDEKVQGLYGIVEALDGNENEQVQNFGQILDHLRLDSRPMDETYYNAIMKYVKFKMEQAGVEEIDDSNQQNTLESMFK